MRNKLVGVLLPCLLCFVALPAIAPAAETDWPAIEAPHTKAWTRWWWHGSAVTAGDLTAQMEKCAAAGIGGLEITPIYGIRGGESEFINYLSPQWIDMFVHTLREADRLGMQIDMSTGTGWPFGGNWVDADTACRTLALKAYDLGDKTTLAEPVQMIQQPAVSAIGRRVSIDELKEPLGENPNLQALALEKVKFKKPLPLLALVASGPEGEARDITDRVAPDGALDWEAPGQGWKLYAVFLGWHGKMVERAGPGGEGNVIDHFSRKALGAYLKPFDEAFAGHDVKSFRAFFNDSYEVDDGGGNSNVTADFFAEFERRRGYDLGDRLPALFGNDSPEYNARVLCDYRETISDLLLEEFTVPWTDWAHRHDALTRNQAHGSPANILDLYAATDIPETEGTDRIAFLSASSAAHVTGKPLTSAEACTWLDEHFLGTLAAAKTWCDRYFLGGVNHICYHGTCFSPDSEPWPGRLFYASLELQPTNPQWVHFKALNDYVARCQSFLQAGKPDNDVLVYYPIHDEWARGEGPNMPHFKGDMSGSSARRTAESLLDAGLTLDLVSDRQLAAVEVEAGKLKVGGGTYRALILPAARTMPLATLKKINDLAAAGADIRTDGALPTSVAGMAGVSEPAAEFARVAAELEGRVTRGLDNLPGEPLVADTPLEFIRRRFDDGVAYFIVNADSTAYNGMVKLNVTAKGAALFDPHTGASGVAHADFTDDGTNVFLSLPPGGSCIVRTHDRPIDGSAFPYANPAGPATTLEGPWSLEFIAGGPELPEKIEPAALGSWTELSGDAVKNFSGTARYRTEFAAPTGDAEAWLLDLGKVHESAEVRLNGDLLGVVFNPPHQLRIPAGKFKPTNVLEIEVANLMANRIADLDRRGVRWQKFYNVNIAPRRGENRGPGGVFSAAKWEPLPSGLLGPVTLTPVVSAVEPH